MKSDCVWRSISIQYVQIEPGVNFDLGNGSFLSKSVTKPALWASFEVNFMADFKNKHTVAKPLSLAKRGCLGGEKPKRNDSVTVVRNWPTLRRSPRREKRM